MILIVEFITSINLKIFKIIGQFSNMEFVSKYMKWNFHLVEVNMKVSIVSLWVHNETPFKINYHNNEKCQHFIMSCY